MKRIAALLLTLAVALCAALPVLAAGTIEVTEDVSVSDAYDWTRFKGQNVTLNVYNWGEYISNGSDDSVDVVAAFEKLTGIKVDGVTVPADQYTVGADLTMVTLKNEYLAALTAGKHTLTVVYSDGECSANFEIQADASHTHQYGTEWKYDETNHWHECSCGDTADKAAHTFVWKVDQAATAEATGLQHEECSVCGAKRNENSVIEKLTDDNSGSTDNTGAADATDQTGSAASTDHTDAADTTGNQGDAASPSTGEHSSLLLWITLLLISGGVLTGVRYARRCATR